MPITQDAQATLLLTAHFSKSINHAVKPLSVREWGRLFKWLTKSRLTPAHLTTGDLAKRLNGWIDKDVSLQRLKALLDRGTALGLSMDKWERSGLWVLAQSDADYPQRLISKLPVQSPPILFGCGNHELLADGIPTVAVAGSRNATNENIEYSQEVGRLAAEKGLLVVSGGAKGVDEAAMLGALKAEGTAIGVLADGLLKEALSAKYRSYLMNKDLALISPFNPEAAFDSGNRMSRNKLIYCLSIFALVVHADLGSGGTWTGALENLNNDWAQLWVKKDPSSRGNCALAGQPDAGEVESLDKVGDLFDHYRPSEMEMGIFEYFLKRIRPFCSERPRTRDELIQHFSTDKLLRDQLDSWLKHACKAQRIQEDQDTKEFRWIFDEQLALGERVQSLAGEVGTSPKLSVVQAGLSDRIAPES